MAVPDAGCGGILLAVVNDGCGRERLGSHGSRRRCLGRWDRRRFSWQFPNTGSGGVWRREFSWQSQMLFVAGGSWVFQGSARNWLCRGEAGVLMTVPDGDCRGWKGLALMAFPDAGRWGETGVLMAVPDTGSGWVFMAVSDAGFLV